MTREEARAVGLVGTIVGLRMLGIFLVLPIFSTYALQYPRATLPLVGLAFGIYALVQSLFQIPYGWASDRLGRKPLLITGLLLFAAGSVLCGMADSITGLIVGRALQGSGAVSAVAIAALGDLTRPQVRAQAFTLMGILIGVSFVVGLLGGPIIAAHAGFRALFYLLAVLGAMAAGLAWIAFPVRTRTLARTSRMGLRGLWAHVELRRLFGAAFILSFTLNLYFFIYPLSWTALSTSRESLWRIYLVIFLPAMVLVFPYIRHAERQRRLVLPIRLGWLSMLAGLAVYLSQPAAVISLYLSGILFFSGYSLFQPLVPTFLTQRIAPDTRGTATGFYSLSGFLGAALGGFLAGLLFHRDTAYPALLAMVLLVMWLGLGLPTPPPPTDSV